MVAAARCGAARKYGQGAAEEAELNLEFHEDGAMSGRLVGRFLDCYVSEKKNAAPEGAAKEMTSSDSKVATGNTDASQAL
jgi:hypothetical protein